MESYLKSALSVLVLVVGMNSLRAQAPNRINYQAVARNTVSGAELSNQSIYVVVKILENGPNGSIVYQEDHAEVETNMFGLFTIAIGGGEAMTGSFQNIQWQTGSYWLQIDLDAGNGLEPMGAMQFVTVPYAFHAETVTNADDADADPQNELVEALDFDISTNILSLIQPGSVLTQDLSSLVNDADADPQNELVEDLDFDPSTNILSLLQPGSVLTQDLSELVNDADSDPENELITSIQLLGTDLIVQEAQPWTVSLSQLINDADADPGNELITGLTLTDDTLLSIQEGGVAHDVSLAALKEDQYWAADGSGSNITNISSKVGIGTLNPTSTFDVNGSVSYGVRIEANPGFPTTFVNVTNTDHIIVCKMNTLPLNTVTVNMPMSASCEGREIIIRKTGLGPLYGTVYINFQTGDHVDYLITNNQMTEGKETATYISLGDDGWTRLYKE